MKFDLFADGIANGVVRIDFYVARPAEQPQAAAGTGEAEREVHLSVNLPLPTFVGSMNVLQRLMVELVERGVISANRPPEPTRPSDA